eukprot:c28947_g1_i3 orf=169-2403(+)
MARDSDDRRWRRQNVGSVEDLDSSKALFEPGTSEQKRDLVKDPDTIPTERAELENINDDNALLDKIEKPNTLFRSCQSVSFDPLDDQIEGFVDEEQLGKENNSSTEHAGKVLLSLSTAKQSGGVPMLKGRRGSTSYGKEGSPETSNVSGSDGEQSDGANQAGVIDDLEGIRHETMKKFIKFISDANGKLEKGWEVEINRRYGRINKFFISPKKQRFRSRIEVAKFLGLHKTGQKLVQRKMPSSVHQESNAGLNQDNSAIIGNRQDLQLVPLVVNGSIEGGTDQGNAFSVPTSYRGKDFIPAKFNDKEKDFVNLEKGNQMRSEEGQRLDKNDTTDTKKAQPSPFVVSQRCQDVLRHIVSADKFAALCNMFHGVPAGFWDKGFQAKAPALVTGALNFQLVTTRMAAGAYGETPELFLTDMQQVWKNIHSIGNELIFLADSLSKAFDALYKEQVLSLFPGSEERERFDREPFVLKHCLQGKQLKNQTDFGLHPHQAVGAGSVSPHAMKGIRKPGGRVQSNRLFKMSGSFHSPLTLPISIEERACRICGMNQGTDCIVCSSCNAGFHTYCLTPSLAKLPDSEWCCPACAPSALDRRIAGVELSQKARVVSHSGAQNLSLVCELTGDHVNQTTAKMMGGIVKIMSNDSVCKACGKDDKDVLLCDSCESAYHMHCLTPALESIPEGNWYCPTCMATGRKPIDSFVFGIQEAMPTECIEEPLHHCAVCERIGGNAIVPVESALVENPPVAA